MNLILLGMPGAGKGTQAEIIQREQGIANVSTGAMMREVSRAESELGRKVQEYLSSRKTSSRQYNYRNVSRKNK